MTISLNNVTDDRKMTDHATENG